MAKAKQITVSIDDLFGDLFGLNIKGMRSIIDLWVRPSDYAKAAEDPDWEERYTPSIRLWLSLAAAGSFLQFLWISENAPIARVFADGFANAGLQSSSAISLLELGREAAVWSYGLMPILQTIFLIILALLWGVWGQPTSAGLRVRYLLGIIIPSGSLMLLFLPVLAFLPPNSMTMVGLVLAVIAAAVDFQTAARGFMAAETRAGRLLRSLAIATMLFMLNVGVSILVQVAGVIIVAYKYGMTPS